MRQPDADTNGRNLRPVLAPTRGLPSDSARDLASGLREEPRHRTARGIRWKTDTDGALAANEQVDVSDVAETSAPAWRTATGTSASSSQTCRAGRSTTRSAPRPTLSAGSHSVAGAPCRRTAVH